ncbi:DNA/RNA nuclease SfsA [Methanobrevibacter curvatus]|uniref:Sugar fermentation stimulation protein homolog n=1 Tax=Methanobrevibacter curvatus TaxID=49547 RepID=A0A166BAT3_9EURY|nr:DNA/RNA nuclease SfsA [Methanobrevibacter curvatus]KZX13093.1 sugar fermentation stimulation protein A [Methanobrevibacter curvatus]
MTKYIKAKFKECPNRFIAKVEIDGKEEIAHVPNTGRCKELLTPNTIVYLLPSDNPNRKTKYSLHFVENRGYLVSIYSSQANEIVYEAIKAKKIKELNGYNNIKKEKTVGNSRIDLFLEDEKKKHPDCYIEVKGVTLVKDKTAIFPDAPTERGKKHLEELIELKRQGFRAIVFFLIQHPLGNSFKPNWETDLNFSKMLQIAEKEGVEILVYKTINSLDKIEIDENSVEYDLSNH